jgi:glycosyltransferase involved in cell wall biosynthesis
MSNICFFIHNLSSHGGTERISISLANALSALEDFNVFMLSQESFDSAFFPLDATIKTASLSISNADIRSNYFKAVSRERKFLKTNKIDIVIDVDVILSSISLAATAFTPTKVISWEHYNYYTKAESVVRRMARKWAAHCSKALVTLTRQDMQFYKDNCKVRTTIITIPNFIDKFPFSSYADAQKTVLSIGHLERRKGFDLLLDAWNKIDPKVKEGWKLLIIGNGEEKENLEKQIQKDHAGDSVEILPPTNHIGEYYRKAAVFAMSSRAEGLPMVLIEAKSYGIPVIAFDCKTGPQEIVNNEQDGFLIPCFDTEIYAQNLSKLMQEPELRRKLSQNALKDRNRFLIENSLQLWVELLVSPE